MKEYPIEGATEPQKKLTRGVKATPEENTPPWARPRMKNPIKSPPTHSPSLKRTVSQGMTLFLKMKTKKKMMGLRMGSVTTSGPRMKIGG